MENKEKEVILKESSAASRGGFSGRLGYVLATAASAIGLGNIWRFPYLCAKYGGGIFLVVYLVLVMTFGYALIMSETMIGRMTRKSPIGAFKSLSNTKSAAFGGWINALVPFIITPYYSVIGGWVIKYFVAYVRGGTHALADTDYFSGFISNSAQSEIFFIIFIACAILVILGGVEGGVERISKIMMPVLLFLAVAVSIYSCTRPGAVEGIKYLFIPNVKNFSIMTVVAAMGQMFYSLSCAMGILITYGSYTDSKLDVERSTTEVEFFDTLIAILAGLMIIPAIFAFSGGDPDILSSGPSLMFVTLPKVFDSMGLGTPAGILFFALVFMAALTSTISLCETCVSTLVDELHWSRLKATLSFFAFCIVLGSASTMGYGVWANVKILGMQLLDFFDFLSNSVMMPIAALAICILVFHVITLKRMGDEIKLTSRFRREKLYNFSVKYLAPVSLVVVLVSSVLSAFGIIKI